MARTTPAAADSAPEPSEMVDAMDRLTDQLGLVSERLDGEGTDLTEAVSSLRDEIHVLRQAIDELRDDVMWAVRNAMAPHTTPFQLTSMPRDPAAPDFGAGVNSVRPNDLPPERLAAGARDATLSAPTVPVRTVAEDDPSIETSDNPPPTLSVRQFNIDANMAPAIPYCCAQPELEWVGEHDDPSIVCARCCETVAVLPDSSISRSRDNPSPVSSSAVADRGSAEPEADSTGYCCAKPNLQWLGDPDAPGIACTNCGYLIAEEGQVVIWSNASEEAAAQPAEPKGPQQQSLWFEDQS